VENTDVVMETNWSALTMIETVPYCLIELLFLKVISLFDKKD